MDENGSTLMNGDTTFEKECPVIPITPDQNWYSGLEKAPSGKVSFVLYNTAEDARDHINPALKLEFDGAETLYMWFFHKAKIMAEVISNVLGIDG